MVLVVGMDLWKLASKLKQVRVALREWNKVVFGRTTTKIAHFEEQVERLESLAPTRMECIR